MPAYPLHTTRDGQPYPAYLVRCPAHGTTRWAAAESALAAVRRDHTATCGVRVTDLRTRRVDGAPTDIPLGCFPKRKDACG